jgi:hypothetical protein
MGRSWMMIVQIDRELLPQRPIASDRVLEKSLLHITRQVRPVTQSRLSHDLRKASVLVGHKNPSSGLVPCNDIAKLDEGFNAFSRSGQDVG